MEIKTKYNMGDVFYNFDTVTYEHKICGINTLINNEHNDDDHDGEIKVSYLFNGLGWLNEEQLKRDYYNTKEELKEAILKRFGIQNGEE